MELKDAMLWRYATKRMTGQKISPEDLKQIQEAIRLAPSSRGLQPFKVFVVEDKEVKKAIQPIADGQMQIVECSHLFIFAAETSTTRAYLENYIANMASERNIPLEKLETLKQVLLKDQLNMSPEQYYHWAAKQAYIAMSYGQLMANTLGIDASAMEGFNPQALDNFLKLPETGLRTAVLMAVGYRDVSNDFLVKLKKVRKPADALFAVPAL